MTKLLLGLSGGIDSAVAGLLLKKQGFEVIGVTLRIWTEEDSGENQPAYVCDAIHAADMLDIDHHVIDVRADFKKHVVDYFIGAYLNGKTPFPCAVCNPEIKWKVMQEIANKLQCNYIATGHYVKKSKSGNYWNIAMARDKEKDQSFFLWNLSQEMLEKTIFPLGGLKKEEVKQNARENGLEMLSKRKESTGICFLKDQDYRRFLAKEIKNRGLVIPDGQFVDFSGNYLGKHKGYPYFTIGQRRGFGVHFNKVLYVCDVCHEQNLVVLGSKNELYKNSFMVHGYSFYNYRQVSENDEYIVKIRYRKQATPCMIKFMDDPRLEVVLLEPLDMIAPGQVAVFYKKDNIVLGGGYIL